VSIQIVLQVTGMTCGGCETAVRRAVGRVPGVVSVEASHREERVTVTFGDDRPDRGAVVAAIERIGFTVSA
jgi:copper chaperone